MTLSNEAIALNFVKLYYNTLHEDPRELSKLYARDALATHSIIPEPAEGEIILITKHLASETCKGRDAITDFYTRSQLQGARILVSAAESQHSIGTAILISVAGEIAVKGSVAHYRFTQSFIIVESSKPNVFLVFNDIFRLLPDDNFEVRSKEKKEAEKAAAVATAEESTPVAPVAEPTAAEITDAEPAKEEQLSKKGRESKLEELEHKAEHVVEKIIEVAKAIPEAVTEVEDGPAEEEKPKKEIKEEKSKKETAAAPVVSEKENIDDTAEEPAPKAAPTGPVNWAQVISTATPKPLQTPKPKTTKPPASVKSPSPTPATKATTSSPSTGGGHPSGPYLYPVVAHHVHDLKGPEIKTAFEKEFGRVTKVEPRGVWAMVNFEHKEAQAKALSKGTLVIQNTKIVLEKEGDKYKFRQNGPGPKTGKKPVNGGNANNNTNTSGNRKPNDQKKKK